MTEKKDWHTATLGYKATIRDAIKKLSASSLQIILVVEEISAVTLTNLFIAAASAKPPCTTKCSPVIIIFPGA